MTLVPLIACSSDAARKGADSGTGLDSGSVMDVACAGALDGVAAEGEACFVGPDGSVQDLSSTLQEPLTTYAITSAGTLLIGAGVWQSRIEVRVPGVVVSGAGESLTDFRADQTGTALFVFESDDVEIRNLTVRDGRQGIVVETSSVSMSNVTVSDCSDDTGYGGGGVFAVDSDVEMNSVTLLRNLAIAFPPDSGCLFGGGAVHLEASYRVSHLEMYDSVVANNGEIDAFGCGGAVNVCPGCTATFVDTTFSGNESGGMGAAVVANGASLTFLRSTVRQNLGYGLGTIAAVDSDLVMEDSVVEGNEATSSPGGGLYLQGTTASFVRTSFIDNVCATNGGGMALTNTTMSCTHCDFSGNAPDDLYNADNGESLNLGADETFAYGT